MKPMPKTIQIFLPQGDPRGIRVAEITTRIVQVIEVPRSLLRDFLAMPESGQVALYFLFGSDEADSKQNVYIGQTGDLQTRLKSHNKEKEFWERALVLISLTNSLTQTHALFLEWLCIQKAREAGRYADENNNSGSKPHTPAPLEADCMEIFDTGKTLLATLGYPIFSAVGEATAKVKHRIYTLKGRDWNGRGIYTTEGFVVLKDSIARLGNVPSLEGTSDARFRQKLIDMGVMVIKDNQLVFSQDHLFNSPSMAGLAITGRSTNGWTEWKTKDGRTLDEIERSVRA